MIRDDGMNEFKMSKFESQQELYPSPQSGSEKKSAEIISIERPRP
jgi:hypothetical protein